jgi:hypothetical protein
MISTTKQPRERKTVRQLLMHGASSRPDHRFVEQLIELQLPDDVEILNAWSRRPVIETASLR